MLDKKGPYRRENVKMPQLSLFSTKHFQNNPCDSMTNIANRKS